MPEVPGVFPLDEFPIHQIPAPIEWVGSDRNFYDRSYWNAHDRTGDLMMITGIGYYPNLGTKDAFFLLRRGDQQTALHFGDRLDSDRLNQHCGNYRIEVIEPLKTSRRTRPLRPDRQRRTSGLARRRQGPTRRLGAVRARRHRDPPALRIPRLAHQRPVNRHR
ncbi:hypothetical protein [Actinomadura algeriensis]|uniref:Uncharacterized protein n=1 Tax=Actinomadura algeriensis TaxID=1679523 RepID=A0ABR9K223_9ACTN|nr:hypothetical protein [Actinomadura algeriensis]MBE1536900.1 hypothetical protein [Actinomadura algeriensis]